MLDRYLATGVDLLLSVSTCRMKIQIQGISVNKSTYLLCIILFLFCTFVKINYYLIIINYSFIPWYCVFLIIVNSFPPAKNVKPLVQARQRNSQSRHNYMQFANSVHSTKCLLSFTEISTLFREPGSLLNICLNSLKLL